MLNIHQFGPADGSPMLALHGVTGHGARWRRLAEALPDVRLIGVDLRGHGHSTWTPPWGIDIHVTDALDVPDTLQLDAVTLVGHSYGGAIGVHLARTAPHRVNRLVLIDPAIGLDPEDMLETAEAHRTAEVYPDPQAARAAKAESWEGLAADVVDEEVAAHLVEVAPGAWGWRVCQAAVVTAWSEMARPAVAPPPGMPTLLVPAARAEYVSPEWVAACRAALGDDLTVTEFDTGHMVYLERTAEMAALISEFMRTPVGG